MPPPPTRQWITAEITASDEMVDAINDFCIGRGSGGVVIDDSKGHMVRITAYFPADQWESTLTALEDFLCRLTEVFRDLPQPSMVTEPLAHQDWATAWQVNFRPIAVGKRIMVTPPWLDPDPGGRITVRIEPAEAFGTGTHETTQGCLMFLEDAVDDLAGRRVPFTILDIGCGSGILAIAGRKLGASRVTGIDIDPLAIASALRNAELNAVHHGLEFINQQLQDCSTPADIVLANLDSLTLKANLDLLVSLYTRFLIVSGVPLEQWDHVKGLFHTGSSSLKRELTRSEWGCGLFEKTL